MHEVSWKRIDIVTFVLGMQDLIDMFQPKKSRICVTGVSLLNLFILNYRIVLVKWIVYQMSLCCGNRWMYCRLWIAQKDFGWLSSIENFTKFSFIIILIVSQSVSKSCNGPLPKKNSNSQNYSWISFFPLWSSLAQLLIFY